MTSKEKITSAQTSKNLQETQVDEMGDIDIIRACGMAGQSNPLGLSIWRWRYAGDHSESYKIAMELVERGFEVTTVHNVMVHLAKDVCPFCFGRGFDTMRNAPILSDNMCVECQGTGRKPLRGDKEKALADLMMNLERDVAHRIMQKLARQIDF